MANLRLYPSVYRYASTYIEMSAFVIIFDVRGGKFLVTNTAGQTKYSANLDSDPATVVWSPMDDNGYQLETGKYFVKDGEGNATSIIITH